MSGHNSSGKLPIKSGRRCTLLAGNISISLAGSFGLKVRLRASLGFKRITPNLKQRKVEHYAC